MARMHSRKRGKSGSKKPAKKASPSWSRYGAKEVELIVSKLSKEGKSASQIGMILRDIYGVPSVFALCGKSVNAILKDKKALPEIPDDLVALFRKYASIVKHLETNKHDETANRGLLLTESKINRLTKYYKSAGRLPEAWKFDKERVGFYSE